LSPSRCRRASVAIISSPITKKSTKRSRFRTLAWLKVSRSAPSIERTSMPNTFLPIVCPQRHSQKAE
jgi:hypothetical protein